MAKHLNDKVGSMEYDKLIAGITPPVKVASGIITKLSAAATYPRGTVLCRSSGTGGDGKLKILGTIRLFPATSAMVTAPDCGHMMYGRVDQIEDDNEYHSFAMQRVPKFVVDKDKDTRKLRLASRPLAAPRSKAPWMYAANVVGT